MCVDMGKTSSANYLHLVKDADSSFSEHAIKVRKQYTITKQRERWTEDEHNKFLEALKLYGRAWRRIEEHIGSKTTVQIRSHAQKFFSKVERESSSNSPGIVKAIEIPPPRPKKKPSHPYPRKLGHLCSRKGTVVERPLWSSVPKLPVFEQESKSPTSVLSALESDTHGTTNSNSLKHCMSPVSSAGRSGTIDEILSEQGSASKSYLTSAIDKDNQSGPSAVEVNDMSMMEVDLMSIQDPVCSKEATATGEQVTSLKLFGRTVIVDNLPLESFTSKTVLESEKSLSDHNSIDLGTQKIQATEKSASFLYEGRGESNPSYGVISHTAYCLPSHEKITSSAQAKMVPLPCWWALYGGMHFPFSSPQSTELDQSPPQSTDDQFVGNDSTSKESSQTGSSISSSCESAANANEKEPAPELKLRPSKNSAFSTLKPYSVNSSRGFVPYKRCAVEKKLRCRQMACGEGSS